MPVIFARPEEGRPRTEAGGRQPALLTAGVTLEPMTARPSVLFVCVHNAGRSQMAAAFLRRRAGDAIEVRSAGTTPADEIQPVVREAMAEVGVDLGDAVPAALEVAAV